MINIPYKIKEKTSKGICIGILHIPLSYIKYLLYSRVAQLVEHGAVNSRVVGSSPIAGAFNNITCVRPGIRTQRDSPKKDGTRAIEV